MKKGDFLLLEFTGRVKSTGEIFDLTSEEEAKKEGIYNKERKYKPVLVILGAGDALPGVEKQLEKMKVGEERKFELNPKEGFGKRNPNAVKVVSIAKFYEKNINPIPGLYVDIDGMACRIQSVSGGRVRVDFNHPLAGKELEYRVKIVKKIRGIKEKIEAILERYGLEAKLSMKDGNAEVKLGKKMNESVEKEIKAFIKQWVKPLKEIRFVYRNEDYILRHQH